MKRNYHIPRHLVLVCLGALASSVSAQETAWKFRWTKDQILTYQAEHKTNIEEVAQGSKTVSASKLKVVKRWQVIDVDADGIATLQFSLASLRTEQTRPSGEVLVFDSAEPDKGSPELRQQMSKFLGQILVVVRLDSQGQVREVKQGPPGRYEEEPPFALALPAVPAKEGLAWTRPYQITLEGDRKVEASERYQCTKLMPGKAVFKVAHQIKAMPENAKEQIPLIQKLSEGEITFDLAAGRVMQVEFTIDRTLMNHHGEGSSYHFQSWFSERLTDAK